MSTFLELCQKTRDRAGISRFATPTAVTNQVGQLSYLIDNVSRADLYIQRLHRDWNFLFTEYTFEPAPIYWTNAAGEYMLNAAGEQMYTMPDPGLPVGERVVDKPVTAWHFDLESFFMGKGTRDATPLTYMTFKSFRAAHYSEVSPNNVPSVFTIKPNGNILVSPPPSSGQVLSCDFWKNPVKMTGDTDESDIPEKFEDAIIELAVFYYAKKLHDDGLMASSWGNFRNELRLLEDNQLPERYETMSNPPQLIIRAE